MSVGNSYLKFLLFEKVFPGDEARSELSNFPSTHSSPINLKLGLKLYTWHDYWLEPWNSGISPTHNWLFSHKELGEWKQQSTNLCFCICAWLNIISRNVVFLLTKSSSIDLLRRGHGSSQVRPVSLHCLPTIYTGLVGRRHSWKTTDEIAQTGICWKKHKSESLTGTSIMPKLLG